MQTCAMHLLVHHSSIADTNLQASAAWQQVVQRSSAAHEKLEMAEAGRLLYDFVWGDFADWYIEV